MMINTVLPLTARQLWDRVQFIEVKHQPVLYWEFENAEEAMKHLSDHDKIFRIFAYQHQRPALITERASGESWCIRPRRVVGTIPTLDFIPLPPAAAEAGGIAPQPGTDAERFLVFAKGSLDGPIVDLLPDMKNSDTPLGIVRWDTQTQVVVNAPSQQIPIGESLEETLNHSRWNYWLRDQLGDFIQACEQRLRLDGSNAVNVTYLTFDPVDLAAGGDGKWMRTRVRFRFLDCGRFGTFQTAESLGFEDIAPHQGAAPSLELEFVA